MRTQWYRFPPPLAAAVWRCYHARDGIGHAAMTEVNHTGSRRVRDRIEHGGIFVFVGVGSRRARDGIVHRLPQDLPDIGSRHARDGVGHSARPQGFRGGNRRTLWNLGTTEGLARTLAVGAAPSVGSRQRGRRRRPSRTPNHASPHREGPANARRKYLPLPTLRLPCPSGKATSEKARPGVKAGYGQQGVQTSPPPKGSGDRRRFTRDECVVPLARP